MSDSTCGRIPPGSGRSWKEENLPFIAFHPSLRVKINLCTSLLCLSTLKVKGAKRPVMLQKDPEDMNSLSSSSAPPPLSVNAVATIVLHPLAFSESCTAMRSLCLFASLFLSPPPSHSFPLSISPPLLNFQSHSGAEDIPPFPLLLPSSSSFSSFLVLSLSHGKKSSPISSSDPNCLSAFFPPFCLSFRLSVHLFAFRTI